MSACWKKLAENPVIGSVKVECTGKANVHYGKKPLYCLKSIPFQKNRRAFDDSGHSAWLYVTNPNSPVVTADCWIYNRITAPQESEIRKYRTSSPPAVASYAHPHAEFTPLQSDIFEFKWSHDGRSVAVLINGIPFGFIPTRCSAGL